MLQAKRQAYRRHELINFISIMTTERASLYYDVCEAMFLHIFNVFHYRCTWNIFWHRYFARIQHRSKNATENL